MNNSVTILNQLFNIIPDLSFPLYNDHMSKKNIHKAMMSGDGQCAIDNSYRGPLDKHHINGRDVPDWDSPWNVVYVSPNIHRKIHEGEIIVEGWFQSSRGRTLIWHKKNENSITNFCSTPHIIKRNQRD